MLKLGSIRDQTNVKSFVRDVPGIFESYTRWILAILGVGRGKLSYMCPKGEGGGFVRQPGGGGWICLSVTEVHLTQSSPKKNSSIFLSQSLPQSFCCTGVTRKGCWGDHISRTHCIFHQTCLSWKTKFSPSHRNFEQNTPRGGLQRMCVHGDGL